MIWMAMELLEGESLRERLLREGAVRPALALEWSAQCADGLQAAHDAAPVPVAKPTPKPVVKPKPTTKKPCADELFPAVPCK